MSALDTKALLEGVTPGPWIVVDNRNLNGAFWICHPDEFTSHAEVRGGSAEADELGNEEANARLIASAPRLARRVIELEEALREIAETGRGRDLNWGDAQDAIDTAKAALKGEGE